MSVKQLKVTAWTVTGIAAGLALLAWGQGLRWDISNLNSYRLFPLFGLLAFSLMWAHYVMAALRQSRGIKKAALKTYFETTSLLVLVFLVLHPGLLAWQMWQRGFGLPPGSLLQYVGASLRIWILIGIMAWVVFALYESRRRFSTKAWWPAVQVASDVAIVLIFFHGLRLGSDLHTGWYRLVWLGYGVTLAAALGYMYYQRLRTAKPS